MTTQDTVTEGDASAKTQPRKKPQKRLIAFLKDKGGTGASFLARLLGEMHRKNNSGALLVDADGTVGALYQHLGLRDVPDAEQASSGVMTFALHGSERDRDEILSVLDTKRELIVMDMPATSLTMTRKMEVDYSWHTIARERGYRLTVVAPITPYKASMFDLQDAIELIGKDADYVAVVNLGLAEDRFDFPLWDASSARARLKDMGGVEIEFPRLKPRIAALLDKEDLTFHAGLNSTELSTADKARLQKWIKEAEDAFLSAAAILGLER
uniref:CobQ/CobB/MinD/ParA nucleotide binding domain-containing protein n=1 Tax=mine drainage metagenome TaxID=410659 RepID=E6Q2S7_9ZZZZ